MRHQLAESIRTYFELCNGRDTAGVTECFTPHAIVSDEEHKHRGHPAIQSWLEDSKKKFDYRVEPISASGAGEHVKVAAKVVGNFPGSPVQLYHSFQLQGGKIQSLEIK